MSVRSWTSRVTIGVTLFAGVFLFNFLVCHPVDFVRTDPKPTEWTTYANAKYGFVVDIPSNWSLKETALGVEIYHPESKRFISVKALAEESSLLALPADEYAIERASDHHPYLETPITTPIPIRSSQGLSGYQIRPRFRAGQDWSKVQENWIGKCSATGGVYSYLPTQFLGDAYCTYVEIMTIGAPDAVYEKVLNSYRHRYKTLRQHDLMAMWLIDTSQTPSPGISYVGETRGFYHDFDGDGTDELLIAGMPRNMEDTKERCFFRVLKKQNGQWTLMIQEKFSENSFHSSDIKMLNIDNQYGGDVFLRFVEHGNPWGKNTTVIVFWDGQKYRSAHFGPFGDAKDIDGDGRDEVIYTTNSYFSQGAIASWYDIYEYRRGEFVEVNLKYQNYFRDIILPRYQEQIETVRGEIALTRIEKFKGPAYQLLHCLERYIDRSSMLAQGKPLEAGR